MEWITSLNDYAGLLALLALLAAILVPFIIYHMEKKEASRAAQDELNAMESNSHFPMSIEERKYYTRKSVLEKKARK